MKYSFLARSLALAGILILPATARAQLAASTATPKVTMTVGVPASATPVVASGGTLPYAYSIAPSLPAGLALDIDTGAVAGTPSASILTPSFAGLESFETETTRWAYEFRLGAEPNGQLTFSNNRLEFTKAAGAGSHVRGWDGDPGSSASRAMASYSQSWIAEISVSHSFATAAGEFASLGLEVAGGSGQYSSIMVSNWQGAPRVRAEGAGATASEVVLSPGTAAIRLRLRWDAGAKVLHASFSPDAGQTFVDVLSFTPDTQWSVSPLPGFYLEVFGNSNAAAEIPGGTLFADDLKVTAAAPTTYQVTVTDNPGATASAAFELTINPAPLAISKQPWHGVISRGQPVSFSVSATGGTSAGAYSYQWRRNGTAIPGATHQIHLISAVDEGVTGDYDVVVGDGTSTVIGGPAALRLATPNLWEWRNRLPVGTDLAAVAFGAGRYVAVGWSGTIVTSTDGTTWTPQSQRPPAAFYNIAYSGTDFVIVGSTGIVLRSSDGLDWTQHNVGTSAYLYGITYGHGKWVATGAGGVIFVSADGLSWTPKTVPGFTAMLYAVTRTATGFMAVSHEGHVLTTDVDATIWQVAQPAAGTPLFDVVHANGLYVASGVERVYTSADGVVWTAATPVADPGVEWNAIAATAGGFTIAGATYGNTSATPNGYVIHSTDGISWTRKTLPPGPGLEGIAHGSAGYVAVGLVGQMVASADGGAWSVTSAGPSIPGQFFAGATGPEGTLFAGQFGKVYRSTNHLTDWTSVDVGTTSSLYAAVHAAGRYVIVGGNDNPTAGVSVVLSSSTGAPGTWSKVEIAGPQFLTAITYDSEAGRYVAAGFGGRIYWATDPAASWTEVTSPTGMTLRAAASAGGRYVLVGDGGAVLHSGDGINWTAAPGITGVSLQAVAFGAGRFVAGGSNGSDAALRTIIITSVDGGDTWQNVPVPYTGSIRGMTHADGRFITVGGTSSILSSEDGVTWNANTSQYSGLFRAIVRTPEGLLASGTSGVVASISAPRTEQGVPHQNVTVGTPVSFTPVLAAGGHAPYTFNVSPNLPPGLVFDPATGAISGTPADGAGIPVFAGSDDFNAGSDAKWAYYFRLDPASTNGELAFANGRLDFTKAAGPASYFIGWDGDPTSPASHSNASFMTSWVAELTVTNTMAAAAGEHATIGFEVAAPGNYAAIMLGNATGAYVRAEGTGTGATSVPVTSDTGVRLRFAWDATTRVLTGSYSTDGITYTTVKTFLPTTEWAKTPESTGFYVEAFGNSNAAGLIAPGTVWADDFKLIATSAATTTHTVAVSDAVGMVASNTFVLTATPPNPTITSVSPAQAPAGATVTIAGTHLGGVTAVEFNGRVASVTMISETGITAVVPADDATGTITLRTWWGATVVSPAPFTVVVPPALLDQPSDRLAVVGAGVEWRVSASGTPPLAYAWSKDGAALPGASGPSLVLERLNDSQAGVYTVRVTNSAGSATSAGATLNVLPADPVLWQQFSSRSTEQSPGRTVHVGGMVYVPWSVQDRMPDMAGGRFVGALARFSESTGAYDPAFRLDPHFRSAMHLEAQPDGKLLIAVRAGDGSTVVRTSADGVVDPSFVAPVFAHGIRFVKLQSDGKVIVVATDNRDPNAPAASLAASAPTLHRLNADGSVDTGFTPAVLGTGSVVFGMPTVGSDGKIYLAGYIPSVNGTARLNIARLNADGTLDAAYADPSTLPAGFASTQARAVMLQSDGRAVYVGDFRYTGRGTGEDPIMAIRLSTSGAVDTGFAMPLRSQVGLGSGGWRLRAALINADDTIVAVSDRLVRLTADGAIDTGFVVRGFERETFWVSHGADGRLYVPDQSGVVGQATMISTAGSGIARFQADGTPDQPLPMGGWGRVAYPTSGAVLSDGRVWVAGNFNRYGGIPVPGLAQFGWDGMLTAARVASTRAMTYATLAPAGEDRIFAVLTTSGNAGEPSTPALARVLADGSVDTTFAPDLPAGYDLNAASLHRAPDGGVMLAQGSITAWAALHGTTGNALLRLKADGTRDSAYAPTLASVAVVERNAANAITMIRTGGLNVAQVLPDGGALIVASSIDGNLRLLRLTAAGAVDSTFNAPSFGVISPFVGYTSSMTDPVTGTTAQFNVSTYSAADLLRTAVQMPDGKVYVGGRIAMEGSPRGLIRLNADGSIDPTFTGTGISPASPDAGPYVSALSVDAAGRLYVAGRFGSFNGMPAPGLFRIAADGTVDTAWTPPFGIADAPVASASLVPAGEHLYVFGTVHGEGDPLPVGYAIAHIPGPLKVTQAPAGTVALTGTPVSLTVSVESPSAVTYQWHKDGAAVSGATGSALTLPAVTLSDEGLYSVTVANDAGSLTTHPVKLTVNAPPVISQQPANATAVVGTSVSFDVAATGKPAVAYQWYKGTTAIAGATGTTLLLPNVQTTTAGSYSVRVSNEVATITSTAATLTVNPVAPVITSPVSIGGIVGRSFLYAATTNATPRTLSTTALPAGLVFDASSGIISGVPTIAGTTDVTVTATNVTGTGTRVVTITISTPPPIINSSLSTGGRVGEAFTYVIEAVNVPTTYDAFGLPEGLTINSTTGVISGTPSAAGTFDIVLSATNAGGTVTRSLVITVEPALNAPVFTGGTGLSGTQGDAFSFVPAFGAASSFALVSLADGASSTLPSGLEFNTATGAITGTPAQTGVFPLAVRATNGGGSTTVTFTLTVNPAPTAPAITSQSTASGAVGTAFAFTLTSSPAATSFAVSNLAPGLTFDATTGAITGTPTAFGTFNVGVSATNAAGTGAASVLVLSIAPPPNAPMVTSAPVVSGRAGESFAFTLLATQSPTLFEIVSGALPAGLSLNAVSGVISGTPTQAGQIRAWVVAQNSSGRGYAQEVLFSLQPASTTPVITSNGTAAGQVGQPLQYVITATNSPTVFTAAGLPAGLVVDATSGVISGVPIEATTQPVAVTLTAAAGAEVSLPKTLLLSISPAVATPKITSAGSASGRVGTSFSYQITASEAATSFAAVGLPAGLSVAPATGLITGTPSQAGNFAVSLRAANAAGVGAASTLLLTIGSAPLAPSITSASTTSGKVGVALSYSVTATPGPITNYSLSGTLPLGLAFNTSTGVLSGKPAESGLFSLTLVATSAGGTSLPQTFLIHINPADNVPVVTSPIYATATVGAAFGYQVTATNTDATPVTFDAVNLPPGLALNPTNGLVQGQPTEAGEFTTSLVVTNAAGAGPARTLTLFVQPAAEAPVVISGASASAQVGQPFGFQIAATNSPVSYDVLGAPAWMVVNGTTGTISGTPATAGVTTVQLTATNAAGTSNPSALTITIAPAANTPVITSSRTASGQVGSGFNYTIGATNTPTAFVATGLPAGLALNGSVITGIPKASGQFEVTLVASNAQGSGAPITLIITLQPNISFVLPNN